MPHKIRKKKNPMETELTSNLCCHIWVYFPLLFPRDDLQISFTWQWVKDNQWTNKPRWWHRCLQYVSAGICIKKNESTILHTQMCMHRDYCKKQSQFCSLSETKDTIKEKQAILQCMYFMSRTKGFQSCVMTCWSNTAQSFLCDDWCRSSFVQSFLCDRWCQLRFIQSFPWNDWCWLSFAQSFCCKQDLRTTLADYAAICLCSVLATMNELLKW